MTAALSTRHIPDADFGPTLRHVRQARRLSLRQLAAKLQMSHGYLGSLERGEKAPSTRLAAQLVDALCVDGDPATVILRNGIPGVGRDGHRRAP
ncbi:helix-turn-helix domain-containing protein [Dactylosporangium sp. CA-139066]|uniref:helix-turn-helix domain-containing protein n=1 Tax=Dactylosporangium sp. CA-139066 TaxID=3239930 RepID=UPI003D8E1D15